MRRIRRLTLDDQRGGIFISGLVMVSVMTLLGLALFDLSRIENTLIIGDAMARQTLYCAEAALARTMNDPTAGGRVDQINGDVAAGPGSSRSWNGDTYTTSAGTCTVNVLFRDVVAAPCSATTPCRFLTATATGPDGVTQRIVQIQLDFRAPQFEYVAVANAGNFMIGGNPSMPGAPGPGADIVNGDVFVAGAVFAGAPTASCTTGGKGACAQSTSQINPRTTTDTRPTVSIATGTLVNGSNWTLGQTDNSGNWPAAGDAIPFGEQSNMPTPNVTGYVNSVTAASGSTVGGVYSPGSFQGSPVYNLPAIFAALGANSDGSLTRPAGCPSTRPATASGNCKIYWDLDQLRLKKNPSDRSSESSLTTGDDYYFDGVFQGEIFSGSRTGQRGAQRLVDLNIPGATAPPIFVGDNIRFSWIDPSTEVTYGFAINGRGTLVATNDVLISDNVIYREGLGNTGQSTADMLGLVAQRDIWFGDPRYGTFYEGSGIMLAGRDFNFVFFDNSGNPKTPENEVTLNGTMLANRQVAVFRDFANSSGSSSSSSCNPGTTGCQPIRFDPTDTSCGATTGCWRFILRDPSTGNITFDTTKTSFMECGPGAASCPSGSRRVSHYQMTLNHDTRLLLTNVNLAPPGLPTGASSVFNRSWRDWQLCPTCN
jgi:hypothetical protein